MPKLVKALGADDRYNLLLGIIGYLLRHESAQIDDLATHFKTTSEHIRSAISTIALSGFVEAGTHQVLPFNFDWEALEDDGTVTFIDDDIVTEAPRISTAQAAALATGLVYLRNLPEFANDSDLNELIKQFGSSEVNPNPPIFDIKPGTIDEATAKVIAAINARRSLRVDYTNLAGEETSRVIDPIKLVDSDGHTAVLAWCQSANAQRNFRVDRMRRIEQLEGAISEEAKKLHDEADTLSDNPYNPQETDFDVVVEVSPEAYSLVSQFTVVDQPTKANDGVIRATIKVGRLENLGKLIARFGGAAKVIEPQIAREIVRDYALAALGRKPLSPMEVSVE